MLAQNPFESPLDYQRLLKRFDTALQCGQHLKTWLSEVSGDIERRRSGRISSGRSQKMAIDLRDLHVGDPVAENESDQIQEYFVETNAYRAALEGRQTVFVGRKGAGKTAIFRRVSDQLRGRANNLVCEIRPLSHELEGIVRVLKQTEEQSERGFLVESIWKYLIYTQLANSLLEDLNSRPVHYEPTGPENAFLDFIQSQANYVIPSFSDRLENAITELARVDLNASRQTEKARVSELFHEQLLARLSDLLFAALQERPRVAVMVDNLDKIWKKRPDIGLLAELIIGLLSVSERIRDDFHIYSSRRRGTSLTLAVFIRSDIYSVVQEAANERDKISYERLTWEDPELLIRVIEDRLLSSSNPSWEPQDMWDRFFVDGVEGLPIFQFITSSILPRPRDAIVFVREALGRATNRGHTKVEAEDLLSAKAGYSQFALNAIIAEDDPRQLKLEEIIYEFAGLTRYVSIVEVDECIARAGVTNEYCALYRNMLIDLNFLGLQTSGTQFEYPVDESDRKIKQRVAQRVAANHNVDEVFEINAAFRPVLQITE